MTFAGDAPAIYRLRVQERLDERWAEWFGGMTLVGDADEKSTTLTGEVVDQAALHALLRKLRDLGVVLLSVERLSAITPER
jgi:hypothetical protein